MQTKPTGTWRPEVSAAEPRPHRTQSPVRAGHRIRRQSPGTVRIVHRADPVVRVGSGCRIGGVRLAGGEINVADADSLDDGGVRRRTPGNTAHLNLVPASRGNLVSVPVNVPPAGVATIVVQAVDCRCCPCLS